MPQKTEVTNHGPHEGEARRDLPAQAGGREMDALLPETPLATPAEEDAAAEERLAALEQEHQAFADGVEDEDEQLFVQSFGDAAEVTRADEERNGDNPAMAEPGQDVALRSRMDIDLARAVGSITWVPLMRLPGYSDNGPRGAAIRGLGRSIFRTMETFRAMERACREKRQDPLGQVTCLHYIAGRTSPQIRQQIDEVANWVAANGTAVRAEQLDVGQFSAAMRGYRPLVVVMATETESFCMVRETYANGAPHEAVYVYRWTGGRPLALQRTTRDAPRLEHEVPILEENTALAPPRSEGLNQGVPTLPVGRQVPVTRPAPSARPEHGQAGRRADNSRAGHAGPRPGQAGGGEKELRRPPLFKRLVAGGFSPVPTDAGLVLRGAVDGIEMILRAYGPLTLARRMSVFTLQDPEVELGIVENEADLQVLVEALAAQSPSMRL